MDYKKFIKRLHRRKYLNKSRGNNVNNLKEGSFNSNDENAQTSKKENKNVYLVPLELGNAATHIIEYFERKFREQNITDSIVLVDLEELFNLQIIDKKSLEFIAYHPEPSIEFFRKCCIIAYGNVTGKLYDSFHVAFKNFPKNVGVNIKERNQILEKLNANIFEELVEFEGLILKASVPAERILEKAYICTWCRGKIRVKTHPFNPQNPKKCPYCGKDIKLLDYKTCKIQDLYISLHDVKNTPFPIRVLQRIDKPIYSGKVKIIGILKRNPINKKEYFVEGLHIEKLNKPINVNISKEDEEIINKLSKLPNIVEVLANLFIPFDVPIEIKKALLLQQVGGNKYKDYNAHIHVLLNTKDRNVELIVDRVLELFDNVKFVATPNLRLRKFLPEVKFEDNLDGCRWYNHYYNYFENKLFSLTQGVVVIGYFENLFKKPKLRHENYSWLKLLLGYNEIPIPIDKYGVHTVYFPINIGVLGITSNIKNIPYLTIEKFDLRFTTDKIDLNEELLKKYVFGDKSLKSYSIIVNVGNEKIKLDLRLLEKYLAYARTKTPTFSEDAADVLMHAYVDIRQKYKVTRRRWATLIKLASSLARLRLKSIVEVEDVKEAITILSKCLEELKDSEAW